MAESPDTVPAANGVEDDVTEMDIDDESELDEAVEEEQKNKKGRGRPKKVVNVAASGDNNRKKSVTSKQRGRPKKVAGQAITPVSRGLSRQKKAISYAEKDDSDDDSITPASRGRGRPKKTNTENNESDDDYATTLVSRGHGHSKKAPCSTPSRGSSRPRKLITYTEDDDDDADAFTPVSRGRGRPKKAATYTESDSSDDDDAIASVSRGRGRPKKMISSVGDNTSDEDSATSPTSRGRGRPKKIDREPTVKKPGRGRPPKSQTKSRNSSASSESGDEFSSEYSLSHDSSASDAAISSEEEYVKIYDRSEEGRTAAGKKRRRIKKTKTGKNRKQLTCVHCKEKMDYSKIYYHLIRLHHLVRSRTNPDGVHDLDTVIRTLGKVTCKDCEETFYNFPAYDTHLKKCPGELLITPLHKRSKFSTEDDDGPMTCTLCKACVPGKQFAYHMLRNHHRLCSMKHPEGVEDLTRALKVLKKLICGKCKRKFHAVSVFKAHQDTCTGETSFAPRPRGRPTTGNLTHYVDKCVHCDMVVPKKKLSYHMLRDHHLVWSLRHPEGVHNLERVIMCLGKLECKDCDMIFHKLPDYKTHLKSCRGELLKGAQRAKGRPANVLVADQSSDDEED